MSELYGELNTYGCISSGNAVFSILTGDHSATLPGERVPCEGMLPHFPKSTPLVLYGEMDSDGIFQVDHFCFDTTPKHLSTFLKNTKTLPPRLCNIVTAKYLGQFLWKLDTSLSEQLVNDGLLTRQQADNVISLFLSCTEIFHLWSRLQKIGLSCSQINLLYGKYGFQTASQLLRAPYACAGLAELTLEQSDQLAIMSDMKLGSAFPKYDKFCQQRMNFIIRLAARRLEEGGDCYTSLQTLEKLLIKSSSAGVFGMIDNDLLLATALSGNVFHPVIEDGELRIYLTVYYQKEQEVVSQLHRFLNTKTDPIIVEESALQKYDVDQKAAIAGCLGHSCISAITGGPGTGKTTVLKAVVSAIKDSGLSVSLCAPTGRAAARLSESTKNPASTIHRLLGIRSIAGREPSSTYNSQNPLSADVIVVDESSMISLELFCSLLCAIKNGGRLILVGDPNQLPSVSPGRILADMIDSNAIPIFRLQTIHRQATGSSIVNNAYNILQSERGHIQPLSADKQFEIERVQDSETALEYALQIFIREYDLKSPYQLQILTPTKKGIAGKDNINNSIVDFLPGRLCPKGGFSKYDKVMTIHNCYDEESSYMNGDIGVVSEISENGLFMAGCAKKGIFVKNLRDVDYAYASTTHKAQGSEYDHVVIVLDTEMPGMLYKGLLYTAVTRAKKKVTIISVRNALETAMSNESPVRRSGLRSKLQSAA